MKQKLLSQKSSLLRNNSQMSFNQGNFNRHSSMFLEFVNTDLINMEKDYENDDHTMLVCMLSQSEITAKEIMRQIVKRGQKIVYDEHIETLLPAHSQEWLQGMQEQLVENEYLDYDRGQIEQVNQGLIDDIEPIPVDIEHWRRFQGHIDNPKQITEPQIPKADSRRTSQYHKQTTILVRKSERFDTSPIKMYEDESPSYDIEEENIRSAKLRQLSIQHQKEKNDKVKLIEAQEQVKQLKRLNVDSKSRYTYDYEGRLIVQKPPDMDRYPKSFEKVNDRLSLIEVRDKYPDHKTKQEIILNKEKNAFQPNNSIANSLTARSNNSQIELITLKEGVSIIEGKNEKTNKRHEPFLSFNLNDHHLLIESLNKPKLQMTKSEYRLLTNQYQTTYKSQNNNRKLSTQTNNNLQEIPPIDSSIIQQNNQSMTSSLQYKLNGSISIVSDVSELLVHDERISFPPQQLPPPQPQVVKTPNLPLINNSIVKLPKSYSCEGTLPKILSKNPRERIPNKAIMLRLQ